MGLSHRHVAVVVIEQASSPVRNVRNVRKMVE
jgi:hypothetical protein